MAPCAHCGWGAYGYYHTLLYGIAPICSCCIANSRVLHSGPVSPPLRPLTIPPRRAENSPRPEIGLLSTEVG